MVKAQRLFQPTVIQIYSVVTVCAMCSYSWKSVIFSVTSTYHVTYTAIFKWDAAKMWKAVTEIFTRWSEFPVKKVVHLLLFSADQNSYILNKTYDFNSCWTKKKKKKHANNQPPPNKNNNHQKTPHNLHKPNFIWETQHAISVWCVLVCAAVCAHSHGAWCCGNNRDVFRGWAHWKRDVQSWTHFSQH